MPIPTSINSLVFQDGFDYYDSFLTKWTANLGSPFPSFQSPGRFGYGQCANIGSEDTPNVYKALNGAPYTRLVYGCAVNYYNSSYPSSQNLPATMLGFIDVNGNQISSLTLDSLGRFRFAGYESNPVIIPIGGWAYVELDVTFSTSASGFFELRVNGQSVMSESNIVTSTQNASYGILLGGNNSGDTLYDDLYVLAPTTTTLGDSFLGDIKIVPLIPDGVGRVTQFTNNISASANWTSVDETPPDGDTTYVFSSTPGQEDSYRLPTPNSLTPVSEVYGVSVYAYARKDDSPSRFLSVGVGNGTTESFDSGTALGSTYSYVQRVLPINPLTSADWAVSDFNNIQIAIKLIS